MQKYTYSQYQLVKKEDIIPHDKLLRFLEYDALKGSLKWRVSHQGAKRGSLAYYYHPGTPRPGEFVAHNTLQFIRVLGMLYKVQDLIWYYVVGAWPKGQIEHVNSIYLDNRFSNLRERSLIPPRHYISEGLTWIKRMIIKTTKMFFYIMDLHRSKVEGMFWCKGSKKWLAQTKVGDEVIILGLFLGKEDAVRALREAREKHLEK